MNLDWLSNKLKGIFFRAMCQVSLTGWIGQMCVISITWQHMKLQERITKTRNGGSSGEGSGLKFR